MSALEPTTIIPTSENPLSFGEARAAVYLRVSSPGQVRTDYDPEGLSLPAQRTACERKASAIGAKVVREVRRARRIRGGTGQAGRVSPDDRGHPRAMRHRLRDRLERFALGTQPRGPLDRPRTHQPSRRAKLIAVKEPIGEDTSHGVMLEGVMAAVACSSPRIEISEDVSRGIRRKIEVGGTHSRAPIGYFNVREPLPQGGEVRTVVVDDDRAEIIRWGYETYATGLYSVADITTLLSARGLRSRPTPCFPYLNR